MLMNFGWIHHFDLQFVHCCWINFFMFKFFPRAFERRVKGGGLLYIFICSYVHMFITSSHLLIFSSSHLHIFTSSLSLSPRSLARALSLSLLPSVAVSLLLFLVSLKAKTEAKLRFYILFCGHPFARNGSSVKNWRKIAILLRSNPFARNEVWVWKTDAKLRFYILGGNPFARESKSVRAKGFGGKTFVCKSVCV